MRDVLEALLALFLLSSPFLAAAVVLALGIAFIAGVPILCAILDRRARRAEAAVARERREHLEEELRFRSVSDAQLRMRLQDTATTVDEVLVVLADRRSLVVELLAIEAAMTGVYRPKRDEKLMAAVRATMDRPNRIPATGFLIVTNQRLLFNGTKEDVKDWMRTWRTILRWERFQEGFRVEASNAVPVFFNMSSVRGLTHPRVLEVLFELAHAEGS